MNENRLPKNAKVRYLFTNGKDNKDYWSTQTYNILKTKIQINKPVLYYLKNGPDQWFTKEELQPINIQDWEYQLADELHKPIIRNFKKRHVIVNGIDEIWCSDLVDMQKFSKWNKGYKYLLMVLDVFSKYGWIEPIKYKNAEAVTNGFKIILDKGRKPKYLWVDKGKEYYNSKFENLLEQQNIKMYSTENEEKSSVCERWNRTIKNIMWKQFTIQGNTVYLDILPKILEEYNNNIHSSIKMSPTEASKKSNEQSVYYNLNSGNDNIQSELKFNIGDKVRISKYKRNVFDKGYTPNWTEEIFVIDKINSTSPITYKIKDLKGEEIKGNFYEQELQKATQDVFRIDKIIRRDYKKKRALVSWKGYSDEFNSWVPLKDLK